MYCSHSPREMSFICYDEFISLKGKVLTIIPNPTKTRLGSPVDNRPSPTSSTPLYKKHNNKNIISHVTLDT